VLGNIIRKGVLAASNLSDLTNVQTARLNLLMSSTVFPGTTYAATSSDRVISCTAVIQVTLPLAASMNAGDEIEICDGSGAASSGAGVTVVRNGSDTIHGGTIGWTIRTPYGFRRVRSDGVSNWTLVRMSTDIQIFQGSGTWTKEPGATWVEVEGIGSGGSGGGGRNGAAGTVRCGGGGGGGAAYNRRHMRAADCGATETVVVGVTMNGGSGPFASDTNGGDGADGIATTFGSTGEKCYVLCQQGFKGKGGTAIGGAGGSGGSGLSSGGAGGSADAAGGVGGGANSTYSSNSTGGGGAGGGITSGNTANNGGLGGAAGAYRSDFGTRATAGVANGGATNGGAGTDNADVNTVVANNGGGGGGAANNGTSVPGFGGNAGGSFTLRYGGGGGGGGAGLNGTGSAAGSGGNSGNGIMIVQQGTQ
jgi:hypothetical protein